MLYPQLRTGSNHRGTWVARSCLKLATLLDMFGEVPQRFHRGSGIIPSLWGKHGEAYQDDICIIKEYRCRGAMQDTHYVDINQRADSLHGDELSV